MILEVRDALHPLLSGLDDVSLCLPKSVFELHNSDLHCPLSCLPLAFKTELDTIPAQSCYLPSLPEARPRDWQARLGAYDKLCVGLVQSGNPGHSRSTTLQTMSALLDSDARFCSLLKEPRIEHAAMAAERCTIVDLNGFLTDFVETASLVSCLDLVITVGHQCGTSCRGARSPDLDPLALPPDYRWLLERADSRWLRAHAVVPAGRASRLSARDELDVLIAAFIPSER